MFRSLKEKAQAVLKSKSKRDSVHQSSATASIAEGSLKHTSERAPSSTDHSTAPPESNQEQELTHFNGVDDGIVPNLRNRTTGAETGTGTEAEEAVEPPSDQDPFSRKYVPFAESSISKSNMLSSPNSHYGRVNPSIMAGFGGDDDSIWLVDDEESEEQIPTSAIEDDARATVESPQSNSQHQGAAYRSSSSDMPPNPLTPDAADPASPGPSTAARSNGYGRIPDSILGGFDDDDENEPSLDNPSTRQKKTSSTSASESPYVALFEQRDYLMTMAYLRRLDQMDTSKEDLADDFSFGQRYHQATDTADVAVTRMRVPAAHVGRQADCSICVETKDVDEFPRFSVTAGCDHPPSTCLECMEMSIQSDLNSKLWTEIRCPECPELLEYADIEKYAGNDTFMRYETLALRAAMSEAEHFIWCTSGCGSGQIHESGQEQPIVICLHCNHLSCFHHNVPWHKSLSCEEYDRLLEDPENFKSRLELENEKMTEAQHAQMEADMKMALNMVAGEQADLRRRREREQEERERATKAAALVRQIAARRRNEEQKSQQMVSNTTKPCPGCGWAIEKSAGCSHMTCTKCRCEFCWACYCLWARGHNNYCQGVRR